MKNLLLAVTILALIPTMGYAYDFTVDGVYYKILTYGEGSNVHVDRGDEYYEGEVIIPASVIYNNVEYKVVGIDYYAFKDNTRLKKVSIPETIESLSSTFNGCSGLTEVNLPTTLKEIHSYTFYGCSSLESISLPNQLETIGGGAFADCVSLKSIVIPKSVNNITSSPISGCPSVSSIIVEDGNLKYDSRGNCNAIIDKESLSLVSGCRNTVIPVEIKGIGADAFNGCTKLQSISIPEDVAKIGCMAFARCTGLKSIKLPDSITEIEPQVFDECSSLENVELPSSLKSIGRYAFFKCSALTAISLPRTVSEIGTYAFAYTPLQSIVIPEGITELESDIFKECHNLSKVFLPSTLKKIGNETFWRCYSLYNVWCYAPVAPYTTNSSFESAPYQYATLHVYKSALDDYKATWPWSDFAVFETIKDGDKEQCAAPSIKYENGRLLFECDTEGAEFSYSITDDDIRKGKAAEIFLCATYNISVYATADGYEDSDVVTATLSWLDSEPKTEGLENGMAQVMAKAILLQSREGTLTIMGMNDGQVASIYNMAGQLMGSTVSSNGTATVNTVMRSGETAVVKIGDKSMKIILK